MALCDAILHNRMMHILAGIFAAFILVNSSMIAHFPGLSSSLLTNVLPIQAYGQLGGSTEMQQEVTPSASSSSSSLPPSPGSLLSSIDFSNMQIVSRNATGYEAIVRQEGGLVWHISANSIPNVSYTPTAEDLERIKATGQPLYNVNVQKVMTDSEVSASAIFFIPYSSIASAANPASTPPFEHDKSGENNNGEDNNNKNGGGEGEEENGGEGGVVEKGETTHEVLGVVAIIKGWLEESKSPILETAPGHKIGNFIEFYEKIAPFVDAAIFGKEVYDAIQELKKYDECRKNDPLTQFSDEDAKRTEQYINNAKFEIVMDLLLKGGTEVLVKLIETGGPEASALVFPISKYGDSVFEDALKEDMKLVRQVSPCVEKVTPDQKQQFWDCMALIHKNLKNFSINDCLNKKGITPPLQEFKR